MRNHAQPAARYGARVSRAQGEQRHAGQAHRRERHERPRHLRGVRVQQREVRGPERLDDVLTVAQDGGGRPTRRRQCRQALHRSRLLLDGVRHESSEGRQREQRDLLDHQAPRRDTAHPPERPDVQHQQHDRQRHHHGLAEQTGGEGAHDQGVASWSRAPGIPRVRAEGEQPEERAEHVLPLGHPGDRLHVRRMDGKGRGDEARSARACPSSRAAGTAAAPR